MENYEYTGVVKMKDNEYALITEYSVRSSNIGSIITIDGKDLQSWGENNKLPFEREQVLRENNIMGELLKTKRDIAIGEGIVPYIERYENGKKFKEMVEIPEHIAEWMDDADFSTYLEDTASQLVLHENAFIQMRQNKAGKIGFLTPTDVRYTRCFKKEKGEVKKYGVIPDIQSKTTEEVITYVKFDKETKAKTSIIHLGDNLLNDGYYNHPTYWGGKHWLVASNNIPKFHNANMRNGYTLRYHVKIPKNYFLDLQKYQQASNDEERTSCIDESNKRKQNFLNKLNETLAGLENTGRTIHSTFEINPQGKEVGIEIVPISVDLNDEALLKLFDKSNPANISAAGIHPSIANVESQGKLSSGSEMRNAFNFYSKVKTREIRRQLLMPFIAMLKYNDWYDRNVKWAFLDIELTKLDDNKQGTQSTIN